LSLNDDFRNSETSGTLFPLCVCVPNAVTRGKQELTVFVKEMRCVLCEVRITCMYEGWNFNSGNYLFTTDTK